MKKRNLLLAAAFCAATVSTSFAQNNLGQDCGCPAVSARPSVLVSTLTTGGAGARELTAANTHLTCNTIWVLDDKIYVPNGKTITIDPGTVVKGAPNPAGDPTNAVALVVERGGKIIADGTQSCPIVFTAQEDPMDGTYSLTNVGKWGGVVILGTATNNLVLPANDVTLGAGHLCVGHSGVGYIEGFNASNGLNLFGAGDAAFPAFNDEDNSGILRYVSIRHAGAILQIGNELNGLSLGSVGRGTTIEHVEVLAAADDNIEFFGGTVNIKNCAGIFGDDDMFDYDLGYSGKVQFYLGVAADSLNTGNAKSTDNGFECDADDNKAATAVSNHSHPIIYNCTLIGNGHINPKADNTGPAGIHAKELTGGEFYNNVFVGFRSGLHLANARSTGTDLGDAFDQWTLTPNPAMTKAQPHTLIVKNNTFVSCGTKGNLTGNTKQYPITTGIMKTTVGGVSVYAPFTPVTAADTAQFYTTDGNVAVASLPGLDGKIAFNGTNSTMLDPFHAIPNANLSSTITAPNDGFFTPVSYRGAFDVNKKVNLLTDWAIMQLQTIQNSNPTDLNGDGVTDSADLTIFLSRYGTTSK